MKKIFTILLLALVLGCSEQKGPGTYVGSATKTMDQLKDSSVFLRVNGKAFTKSDYQTTSRLFDKMNRMRAKDPLEGHNVEAEHAVMARRSFCKSEILRRELMRQYAAAHHVVPSSTNLVEATTLFLKYVRRPTANVDQIVAEIGGKEGSLLRDYLVGDAMDLAVREASDTNHWLRVTEADVIATSNRCAKLNAEGAQSNQVQLAILEKALAEIRQGADFASVARKYSESSDDGDWGEFDREDIDDCPQLAAWMKTAKVGDVSGILELDDGWGVVKYISHDIEDFDPDDPDAADETWHLGRISRTLWEALEPATHDEIIKGTRDSRMRQLQKEIGKRIMETAVVEWPYGTNLFPKVSRPQSRVLKHPGEELAPVTNRTGTAKSKKSVKKEGERK